MSSQILKINPEKLLEFQVTGGVQAHVILELQNVTDQHAAFKIKTTAPRSYLVKPSSGVIAPNSTQNVSILLVPMFEPPRDPVADRFLVQAASVDSNRPLPKEQWSELAMQKDKVEEKRLNVNLMWQGYGSSPSDAIPSVLNKPVPTDYKGLKSVYDELVAYTVSLDKTKKELETELDAALKGKSGAKSVTVGTTASKGIEIWLTMILMLLAALAGRYVRF